MKDKTIFKKLCKVLLLTTFSLFIFVLWKGLSLVMHIHSRLISQRDVELVANTLPGGWSQIVSNSVLCASEMSSDECLTYNEMVTKYLLLGGLKPQLIVLNDNRDLLTIQLQGGFFHRGIIVSVNGDALSSDRAKTAAQTDPSWKRVRLSEYVFWYIE